METPVEKVTHAYFAALVKGDVAAWVDLFDANAVMTDPVGTPPHVGTAAIKAFIEGVFGNFKSLALYEREILSNGDDAAAKWEGIAVGHNGQGVVFSGIDVISINKAGKIETVFAFWDPTPVLLGVGVKP